MRDYAAACWETCEQLHRLMLQDEQPENEKQKMDPDHWFEINLTNALLFANLSLEGLPQLVPGRLFSTRMPRNIVEDETERKDFIEKCRKNDLRVRDVLTKDREKTRKNKTEVSKDIHLQLGCLRANRARRV